MKMSESFFGPKSAKEKARDGREEHKINLQRAREVADYPALYPGQFPRKQAVEAIGQYLGTNWLEKEEYAHIRERMERSVEKGKEWVQKNKWRGQA